MLRRQEFLLPLWARNKSRTNLKECIEIGMCTNILLCSWKTTDTLRHGNSAKQRLKEPYAEIPKGDIALELAIMIAL